MRPFVIFLAVLLLATVLTVPTVSRAINEAPSPAQLHAAIPIPASILPFRPNVQITDGTSPLAWQVEPTMVVTHAGNIFAGWKETDGPDAAGLRVGSSFSTDQGRTWAKNILMNQSHPNQNCHNSDPWMALGPNDRVQYAYLEYDCGSFFDLTNTTTGTDWGQVHYIPGHGGLVDKDSIAIDPVGRVYATWDEGNILALTWTDDNGASWAPIQNPGGIGDAVLGAVVGTAGNSTVYLTWWDIQTSNIMFESSSNRGQTWSTVTQVNDRGGSAQSIGSWQIPIPAMNVDPNSGTIYIAWPDNRNLNQDIYFANSTDGGRTWGTNHRVNDDTGSSTQYMVDLAVDSRGTVHAAWEDKRNGAWNIEYSNSTDGGQTWQSNLRVSSENTPATYDRPGDYFALEAGPNDYIYVIWTDGRGNDFDIYYARSPGFPAATITVTTSPAGFPVTVDGVTGPAPVQFNWTIGSMHNVSVASSIPVSGTARYVWTMWSDGGAISHPIVANADGTITATFKKQYQSQVAADPTGLRVVVDGVSHTATTSFWWDDGSTHSVNAPTPQAVSADVRYVCSSWSDGGAATHIVIVSAPMSLTASFVEQQAMRISTSPAGLSFSVDGATYNGATAFWFEPGSYHTVSVTGLQYASTAGTRYVFQAWSDGDPSATRVIPFVSATSLQAMFSAEYLLTVDSPIPGATGGGWYPSGTSVVATVPSDVYAEGPGERLTFHGWAGNATGSRLASSPIMMDGPKTAVADYGTQFYLDVSSPYAVVSGSGWYDVGSNAAASVSDTQVSLGTGTREIFLGWAGDASGTDATSNAIVMTGAKAATASWKTQYYLTIHTAYGAGTTQDWYDAGTHAVARLDPGIVTISTGTRAVFVSWLGDASGTDPTGSVAILMDRPRTAGASWRTEYELRVTSSHGDTIGGGWYQAGSYAVAAVNASIIGTGPGTRVVFTGWAGDAAGDSASGSSPIAMSAPRTAEAQWSTEYFLRVDSDLGTIAGTGWYADGTPVVLHAPSEMTSGGQTRQFAGWTGDVTSSDTTVTVTMTGPKDVRGTWSTASSLGGISGTTYGLILAVVVIALVVGLLVWRRGRRE